MDFSKFKDFDSHLTVFEAEDVENKKPHHHVTGSVATNPNV